MNTQHKNPESAMALPDANPRGAAGIFSLTLAALGAVAAIFSFAFVGHGKAGAKEPVQVTIRPDAPAVLAAAAVGADDEPEAGTGTFKGVVTFKGEPPKRKVLIGKGDPDNKAKPEDRAICAADDLLSDELLINGKADNAVANVVVYLRKAPEGYTAPPVPAVPAVFDQKGCRFTPHVLVVRCNQKLLIKNGDSLLHNTHITPLKNDGFNKAIGADDRTGVEYVYKKPENQPIPVVCDIHGWMKAHHLPLEHPFAAVTDENGKFEIKGLPPDKHTFTVWHEMSGYLNNKLAVEIKADKVTEEKLSYTAAQFQGGK